MPHVRLKLKKRVDINHFALLDITLFLWSQCGYVSWPTIAFQHEGFLTFARYLFTANAMTPGNATNFFNV